ncbi:MAG: enoyl-CoA hydratase [Salaquimonas sp.]
MGETLLYSEIENGICRIVLNHPARRNALSEAMINELSEALALSQNDAAVRVIILSAKGPVFCAGHDLKEMTEGRKAADRGQAYFAKLMASCSALMQQIVSHSKPIIAEVTGVATAAGCQLVASCDLAVVGQSARFATPGVQIGLFCSTPMVALSRNISRKHAMEMLLTGDMISAVRAQEMGLVNQVVSDDQVASATWELAEKIAAKSSMTLAIGKQAFYKQAEMPLEQAYAFASQTMVENMLKQDAEEGINAFIEKRDPNWTDQ